MEGTLLQVGKPFPLVDLKGCEGLFFSYNEVHIATLVYAVPRMTAEELKLIMYSNGTVGVSMYDGVIYVSAKFGKMDGDAAYHVNRNEIPSEVYVDEPEEGIGMPLYIFPVDSRTNILLGIRLCGMSTRWTREFKKYIEEQRNLPYNEAEFIDKVQNAYQRFSTKDFFSMGVTYKLGTRHNENVINTLILRK